MGVTGIFGRIGAALSFNEASRANTLHLRVGIDSSLARPGRGTGHGRVWGSGVEHLRRVAAIVEDAGDGTSAVRPDVWLTNGHVVPVAVREPVVTLVYEARWVEPSLAADLDPVFLSAIASATAQAVRQATRVLAISFASARNIAQLGVSADRIDVVPPGVDLSVFRPDAAGGRAQVAARTNDDRPYVICVATLFRSKNLSLLQHAVARLGARGLPHRLVLVTRKAEAEGGSTRTLDALAASVAPRPEIFENVTDRELAALMAGAAAFCLPSRFEGFGLPALEAMACGVPVVVSNGGALPEVVADAGLIVEPELAAVEQALAMVLEDRAFAQKLAHKARRRAEEFPWEKTAEGWMRSLKRAAEARCR